MKRTDIFKLIVPFSEIFLKHTQASRPEETSLACVNNNYQTGNVEECEGGGREDKEDQTIPAELHSSKKPFPHRRRGLFQSAHHHDLRSQFTCWKVKMLCVCSVLFSRMSL